MDPQTVNALYNFNINGMSMTYSLLKKKLRKKLRIRKSFTHIQFLHAQVPRRFRFIENPLFFLSYSHTGRNSTTSILAW